MNSNKYYNDILLCLDKEMSFSARGNKLLELSYCTEDIALRNKLIHLSRFVIGWSGYFKTTQKGFEQGKEGFADWQSLKFDLVDYVLKLISLNKPEWVILAERNGWTPPK